MGKIKLKLTKNFSITPNEFLQDENLGLTERGLLATMLSLPPDWRYSIAGLATITPDGKDKVAKAISNPEKFNYLRISYVRKDGKIVSADYTFSGKVLDDVANENATTMSNDKTVTKKSTTVKPATEKLTAEKETSNTVSTDTSNPSIYTHDEIREIIRNNIDYDYWVATYKGGNTSLIYGDLKRLDEIIEIIVDCFMGTTPTIRVAGNNIPRSDVQTRLLLLNQSHIEYVFDCMDQNSTDIKTPKAYLLTALYNAPSTIDNYYAFKTQADTVKNIDDHSD